MKKLFVMLAMSLMVVSSSMVAFAETTDQTTQPPAESEQGGEHISPSHINGPIEEGN